MRMAERAGMGPKEFLHRTGLSPVELDDPRGRISVEKHLRVNAVNVMLSEAGTPPGPVLWKQRLERMGRWFPLHVSAWLNTRSALEAINIYAAHVSLLIGCDRLLVRDGGDAVQVEFRAYGPQHLGAWRAMSAYRTVLAIAQEYGLVGVARCRLRVRGPACLRDGTDGPLQVTFQQAANTLELPSRELRNKNPSFNMAVARITGKKLAMERRDWGRAESFTVQSEHVLDRVAGSSDPGLDEAIARLCTALQLTREELKTALAKEGHSVKELWASHRLRAARHMLLDTRLSVTEIGERLGFARQSAFTRFFTAGAGLSPMAYRFGPEAQ